MMIGAVWEIFEYGMDQTFGLNMQKSGLDDTMAFSLATNRDGTLGAAPERPLLARGRVRFVGEPVAMIVAETRDQHPIEEEVEPLFAFFPPFFFAAIGIQIELGELADPGALLLLAGLTVLAIATKLAGAFPAALSRSSWRDF